MAERTLQSVAGLMQVAPAAAPRMAVALGTEPVLIVARAMTPADPVAVPLPVTSAGIPNDHLEYAATWFSLAAVWIGMTGFLLWRIRRRTV